MVETGCGFTAIRISNTAIDYIEAPNNDKFYGRFRAIRQNYGL